MREKTSMVTSRDVSLENTSESRGRELMIIVNIDITVNYKLRLTLSQASCWNRSTEYSLLRDWRWSSYRRSHVTQHCTTS